MQQLRHQSAYLILFIKTNDMTTQKRKHMTESSVLLGGLSSLQNKQNLNGEEIKQMIDLLKAYQSLCIQREDFNGADSVKNKIQHLKQQELLYRKQTIAVRQKQQIEVICKQGEHQIKQFQNVWDLQIKQLIQQLKHNEDELTRTQKLQTEELVTLLAGELPPKIKYSSVILEKRKYLSNLIKARNYKDAELVKNTLKEVEAEEEARWVEKFEEKKRMRMEKLEKKQVAELQALRVKLEGVFNQKIKERDRKFDILLKKNRKRRIESSKPSKERVRSKNGVLTESKLNFNMSGLHV